MWTGGYSRWNPFNHFHINCQSLLHSQTLFVQPGCQFWSTADSAFLHGIPSLILSQPPPPSSDGNIKKYSWYRQRKSIEVLFFYSFVCTWLELNVFPMKAIAQQRWWDSNAVLHYKSTAQFGLGHYLINCRYVETPNSCHFVITHTYELSVPAFNVINNWGCLHFSPKPTIFSQEVFELISQLTKHTQLSFLWLTGILFRITKNPPRYSARCINRYHRVTSMDMYCISYIKSTWVSKQSRTSTIGDVLLFKETLCFWSLSSVRK